MREDTECAGKLGLTECFAARKRQSSAASHIIRHIAKDGLHHLACRDVLAHNALGFPLHTHRNGLVVLPLGIATPTATQRAALQENDRPYSLSVVK